MTALKALAIIVALAIIPARAQAQELKTANFLDNYLYGYRLNPSVTPAGTAGFFGIGIGNIGLTAESNFGLSNFLFPLADGTLVTGLNSAVSPEQFPGGLARMNRLNAQLSENIFAIGLQGSAGGYYHFEINLVSDNHFGVPRSLFEAFKNNNTTGNYLVENINFRSSNFIEAAFGWSRRFGNLAVGGSLKGLVGVARVDAAVDLEINTAGNELWGRSKCSLMAAIPFLQIGTDADGYYDMSDVAFDKNSIKPAGLGAAVDVGASYYLFNDRLIVGAALRNLGMMRWSTTIYGENTGDRVYVDLDDTDSMTEGLENMIRFKPAAGTSSGRTALMPLSYNVSVKYKPVRLVTLGLVGTVSHYKGFAYKDLRLGAAFTPFRQFNLAASCAVGDAGTNFGVAASVRLLGLNVYAGVDAVKHRVSPQYIPVDPVSTTVNVGVAFAIGKSRKKAAPTED